MNDSSRFDVFLSHNSRDKPAVERLAVKLKTAGLEPWLDKWCLTPGGRWQDELISGLRASAACAVFVGPHGLGDWVHEELGVALDRAAKDRGFRLFLVLLPGLPEPFDAAALPPFLSTRTWVDLRPGVEDNRAFQHLINAIKGVPFGQQAPPEPNMDVCPYRGLQTFDEDHAEYFFGRDNDVQRLTEKLKATHFLAVLGPSGSGKSSLVRAGLVPALRKGMLPGSHDWSISAFTPGAHPLTTLAAQVQRLSEHGSMRRTLDDMGEDARTLHLATVLATSERSLSGRVVWIVDQFEELFTLCKDEQERTSFLANLLYAASVTDGPTIIILTLRADFYPRCAAYPDLSAQVSSHQYLVSPLDHEGLRRAIEEPAWHVGLEFEQGLVGTIFDDVARQPGALPLLEHALLELWERRRGTMLTLEAYRQSGGVQGAIAKRADAIYSAFTPEEQVIARRALLRLTQPGEGTEDTRRRATLGELVTRADAGVSVDAVVQALVEARLLTTSEDESHAHMVEVAHEALIRGWPQLRAWIEEDRSGLRVQRRLTEAALEWQRLDRDESTLYRGARLATAVEWRGQHDDSLNDLERAFLEASATLKEREATQEQERQRRELAAAQRLAHSERRRARVARLFSFGLSAVAILALIATGIAIVQRSQAQTAEHSAQSARAEAELRRSQAQSAQNVAVSRELSANALAILQTDPQLGLLLATAAVRRTPVDEATDALRLAIAQPYPVVEMRGHNGLLFQAVYSADGRYVATASLDRTGRLWDAGTGKQLAVLRGHTGYVVGVAFNRTGTLLATASVDGTARVWAVPSGRLISVLRGHTATISTVAFSPDGRSVLTSSYDNTARIWDVQTGRTRLVLRGHTYPVWIAVYSPDGKYVATSSGDWTARLWDANTGESLHTLQGHQGIVSALAFSPDGTKLATGSWDDTTRIWNVPDGRSIVRVAAHINHVNSVVFSPDSRYVLTASSDGAARVSDATTGAMVSYLFGGQTSTVWYAAFSHDGTSVVTAAADGTARVWSVFGGFQLAVLRGDGGEVYTAQFDRQDDRVLTASRDGVARIWDIDAGRLIAQTPGTAGALSAAYSHDGKTIVSAGADGIARVYDGVSGREITALSGQGGPLSSAEFSPDGKSLATANDHGVTWVWNTATWQRIAVLGGHRTEVNQVTFSADGKFLVTAGLDGIAIVWDARRWKAVITLQGKAGDTTREVYGVDSASFSPDGRLLALGVNGNSTSHGVLVWSTANWHLVKRFQAHSATVWRVSFSPSGRYLVTASADSSARVWDTRTWSSVASLQGHTGAVFAAAFSPDSQWIVTASFDTTLRIWSTRTWQSVAVLFGHHGSAFSAVFSPDGNTVLSTGKDGMIRAHQCDVCAPVDQLLKIAATHLKRTFTTAERKAYLHE